MAHPEVTSSKTADGRLQSVTVKWLESEKQGWIGMVAKRVTWDSAAFSPHEIWRALTIRTDGTLIAENGLPLDGFREGGILPAKKPPKVLKTTFQMVDTIDFSPVSKYRAGRSIPDNYLSIIRTDGTPVHLSWSMLGVTHFQPVVVMLHDVFDRMRPLVAPPEAPRSALDDIFGES